METPPCSKPESLLLQYLTDSLGNSDKFVFEYLDDTSFKVSFFPIICDCEGDIQNSETICTPVSFVVSLKSVPYAKD